MNLCPHCNADNRPNVRFCSNCGTALKGTDTLTPGTQLQGRYRIIRWISGGGMGHIYLVEHAGLGDHLALKEIQVQPAMSTAERAQASQQFQHEARLLAKLRHPNLPRVTDYFEENGRPYLVMDFIEGQTLDEILAQTNGPLPEVQIINWGRQICTVLVYLHSQQPPIIFRDLKPANVILDPQGQIHLIDFGIARLFQPQKGTDTLKMGTPGYAPPEQYGGLGGTDPRSDLYALGATLHHLATGHDPQNEPPFYFTHAPAKSLNPALSEAFSAVLHKATQYRPDDRFASVPEMDAALEVAARGRPPAARAPAKAATPPPAAAYQPPVTTPNQYKPTVQTPAVFVLPNNPASIEWVQVPAGVFLYGDNKKERNIAEAYLIGKYPVTNAQYKCFIDANPNYRVPEHWDKASRSYPAGKADHPVVKVSWHDAMAFCKWANCRLPTEEEWEKAARGIGGHTYPWGEQPPDETLCNFNQNVGGSTPVGHYSPQGDSPYGCADMAGNVWEWTATKYSRIWGDYVLRGSSFDYDARLARCAVRYWVRPDYWYWDFGFRVVVSPFAAG